MLIILVEMGYGGICKYPSRELLVPLAVLSIGEKIRGGLLGGRTHISPK